jgi:hypothetical protein
MPSGDRTGPTGMGPGTGRGAGFCAGFNVPGFANPIPGRGAWRTGRGNFGGGRGRRNMYYATGVPGWMRFGVDPYAAQSNFSNQTHEQELEYLKEQSDHLQNALENISKRIDELEKDVSKNND